MDNFIRKDYAWSKDKVLKIVRLIEADSTLQDIGDHFGITRQAVRAGMSSLPNLKNFWDLHLQRRKNKPSKLYIQKERSCFNTYRLSLMELEELSASDRLKRKRQVFLWKRKKSWSKQNKVPFNVEIYDMVWPDKCPVLGIELDYFSTLKNRNSTCPCFDRVNNKKGYVKGNVKIISMKANILKGDGSLSDFIKIRDYMKTAS